MAPPKKNKIIVPTTPVKQLSKLELIKGAMNKINTKMGANTIGTLTQKAHELTIRYIPTKSPELNKILNGGVGVGKVVEVFGPPDSGKTSIVLDTIGYNMQLDPNFYAAWYETEGHFDVDYAVKTFGIDPDRLSIWYMSDYGAENGLDILESLLRSGAYNMMAVNTIAGLTPADELSGSMSDISMMVQAKMMSKLMRKIVAIAANKKTNVTFINQVRATTSTGPMKSADLPAGGKACAFWASQRINMRNGFMDADDTSKGYDPEVHKRIDVRSVKNRLCTGSNPFKKCSYYIEYGVGIDQVGGIPNLAVEAGVLTKSGAWFYYGTDKDNINTTTSPGKWQGIKALRTFLRDNDAFAEEMRNLIAAAGIETIVVQSMDETEITNAKQLEEEIKKELADTVEE